MTESTEIILNLKISRSKFDLRPDEDHYDKAATIEHDCEKMYPECPGHVLSNLFKIKLKKK